MRAAPRPLLFLLAHAGGSAVVYQSAFKRLAAEFELVPLELPGRGRRFEEPLLRSMELMVTDLYGEAAKFISPGREYAVFGHSLGGLAAFLLAHEIAARGLPPPLRLVVSSARVPGSHAVDPALLSLSDADLWRASADHFGALNRDIIDSEELMLLFAPILRADLGAVVEYRPKGALRPLDLSLRAVFAEDDVVGLKEMEEWRSFVSRPISVTRVAGGHFHPLANPKAVEELISMRGM